MKNETKYRLLLALTIICMTAFTLVSIKTIEEFNSQIEDFNQPRTKFIKTSTVRI